MKNTESWANDILHWHDDIASNPTAFIGVRDAHRDAAALVRQLQAELAEAVAALEAAQMGLRYAVRVWVLSDEIEWSEEEIDKAVERIIDAAKKEAGNEHEH